MEARSSLVLPEYLLSHVEFVKVTRNRGYTNHIPAGRTKNAFLFLLSGRMLLSFTDKDRPRVELKAGEVFFLPKNTRYRSTYGQDQTTVILAQFDLEKGALPSVLESPTVIPDYPEIYEIETLFQASVGLTDPVGRTLFFSYKMYKILWNAVSALAVPKKKYLRLTPALERMQSHKAEQQSVAFYAELCRMSESGFRKLFTEYTSLSPIEYRNALRLEEARRLLETGEFTAEEAADAVGYRSISFFCRSYKHRFATTPTGQRQKTKKSGQEKAETP